MLSDLSGGGGVKHEWEGLRVLKEGLGFRAVNGGHGSAGGGGRGVAQLNVWGGSMSVELVGVRVPEEDSGDDDGDDDDDDDWTVVGDEDGAREAARRPPPSYEYAMRI